MNSIFANVDDWILSLLLAVTMVGSWAGARRRASRRPRLDEEPASKFNDAILALLGLLLAFTFSMSLVKHEQRRQMVVTDSNAIGDFHTCASLLREPVRGQLQAVLRQYVDQRLAIASSGADEEMLQQHLREVEALHGQMQTLVDQAVGEGTPVVVPLVNTLNALTSSHAARLAAVHDRLPPSIVLLLFVAAVVTMAVLGWQQGRAGEHNLGAAIGFTALVCMVVCLILDLNQPRRGWVTVSQEPMQRLQAQLRPAK